MDFSKDINSLNEDLLFAISQASRESIPKTKPPHKNSLPFWNADCSEAVSARKKARRKLQESRNPKDYINFKAFRALARKTIKNAKRNYWTSFCSSLSHKSNVSKVWRTVKKLNNAGSGFSTPAIKINNENISDNKTKADIFAKQFSFVSSTDNYSDKFKTRKENFETEFNNLFNKHSNNKDSINENFCFSELINALKGRKNSSPGKDEICYIMFHHMFKESLILFLNSITIFGLKVLSQILGNMR